jgi:hypothetical protein
MPEPRPSARQKQVVAQRAGERREYCRSPSAFTPDPISVEHIIPRTAGGDNRLSNLALSCQGCNNHKFTSREAPDPASGALVALYHPRQDQWQDHFTWSEDFTLIIGRTSTGRATIAKLRLNRRGVVNLRRALRLIGEHPPPEGAGEDVSD